MDLELKPDDLESGEGTIQKRGRQRQKNYMTPRGLRLLTAELKQLKSQERPKVVETVAWAASNGDRSENADYIYGKKRLREIDGRIQYLMEEIDNASIVDPGQVESDRVLFGATVHVKTEEGKIKVYTIVGSHESDASQGFISWLSPVGQALLQSRQGDVVEYSSPKGEVELEVMKIEYKSIPLIP